MDFLPSLWEPAGGTSAFAEARFVILAFLLRIPFLPHSTGAPPVNQASTSTSWQSSWAPPLGTPLLRLMWVSQQNRDLSRSLAAFQLHGLGPTGGGPSSLHILELSFLIIEECCIIHDLLLTCALPCRLRTRLHIHLGQETPPGGSCHEGVIPFRPPHRCMAESIPGQVARSQGGGPVAEVGPTPKLLSGLDLGCFLASCLGATF